MAQCQVAWQGWQPRKPTSKGERSRQRPVPICTTCQYDVKALPGGTLGWQWQHLQRQGQRQAAFPITTIAYLLGLLATTCRRRPQGRKRKGDHNDTPQTRISNGSSVVDMSTSPRRLWQLPLQLEAQNECRVPLETHKHTATTNTSRHTQSQIKGKNRSPSWTLFGVSPSPHPNAMCLLVCAKRTK